MDAEKHLLQNQQQPVYRRHTRCIKTIYAALLLLCVGLYTYLPTIEEAVIADQDCFDADLGYNCRPEYSHYWGQYSPYFKVPSQIPDEVPKDCEVTFAQILSRHGARDPTLKRTLRLSSTIIRIKALGRLEGKYSFIKNYLFDLGADQLNEFGRRELRQSGRQAKARYDHLGAPFIRASSQQRVIDSATSFVDGYGDGLTVNVVYEGLGFNNTLAHSQCPSIETGPISNVRSGARAAWGNIFLPPIAARLSEDLGMIFTQDDAHNLMSMCPMTTVHDPKGVPTQFCDLFTLDEWKEYNHFEALEKFYGWGRGNPLGPTQGVGFVNELIARMLQKPVNDSTSTNSTLDDDPVTFPLDKKFYADFSHDDDLTSAFFALGLFGSTPMLSITQVDSTDDLNGWSPSRTVPFGGRAYFEKMKCKHHDEELVRAVVNDRVIPLDNCDPDDLGRCTLSAFIDSLSFAQQGGKWPLCYLLAAKLEKATETTLEGIMQNGARSLEL